MKKYLITAAVFLTGTALANAGTVLTTTFGNAAQATATDVTLTNNWADDLDAEVLALLGTVNGNITSLTNTSGNVTLQTSGAAGQSTTFFSPNTNVGNGSPWTSVFTYSGTSGLTSIDGINLQVGLFDSNGTWQSNQASWTGNVGFTAQILDSSDSLLGSFTGQLGDGITGQGSTKFDVNLSGTKLVLDSVDNFKLKISLTDNLSNGCFVGLQSVAYSGSVIPEPSTFGLLAGLGALALAGTRRRRRAK
ncbi:PEP-CTERM sorting domain-containing protein [Candidatus Spyradosoma sp. SGI.093]|uniref:PEP-CTERM sorting domain-containing protein n=1 Tax=Candidatus Spyradosoma sp. SGI.093 TaxID=3420583 RepID=UPI003D04161C